MKSLFKVFLLFLVCSLYEDAFADKPCNDLVDRVLNQLKADKEFFQEPYEFPGNVDPIGAYEIENAHVYGLNTLHRLDDVVPIKKKGITHLKVFLGAGELNLDCSARRKFLHIGKSVNVDATVPFVTMELDVVPKQDGSNPEIKDFKIDEVKGLKIKLSGLGIIRDFLLNAFNKFLGKFFKKAVKQGIEGRLKHFLEKKVTEFQVSHECLNDAWD